MLRIVAAGPCAVQEIADLLPISRPAVSRHLRLLKEAGLVVDHPAGAQRVYELRAEGVVALRAYFDQLWSQSASRFRLVAENVAERPEP